MSVVIETTIGDITVDLYLKERPNACLNFLKLCKIKYYNLCLFYKVERNFIAQTGDPTSTGRGGESIFLHLYGDQAKYFDSELKPRLKHEKMGTLSMVNNGNNMNGSQFFLTLGENLTYLDEVHTVFGEVTEGFDILVKLNEAICDTNNRPYQDIRITHTVVLHDPYADPAGLEIPDASPEPTREMLETDYIAPDEEIDDTKGKNVEEIEEKIKDSEAKARATILEMVGDIPDADVKPPENVLFVCKLNPVTESKDLELIFSRFGTIVSCEVIKDKKTGESLQYAFIEFEKEEDCENAYFKMDNVLIDDRRIHVDFSQSVSKLNWNQKGNFFKENNAHKRDNLIMKSTEKTDGYEMIFDDSHQKESKRKEIYEKQSSHKKISKKSQSYNYRQKSSHERELKYKKSHESDRKDKSKHIKSPSPVKSSQQKTKRYESRSSPVKYSYKEAKIHQSRPLSPVKSSYKETKRYQSRSPSPVKYSSKESKKYRSRSPSPVKYSSKETKKYQSRSPSPVKYSSKESKKYRSRSPSDVKYSSKETKKYRSRSPIQKEIPSSQHKKHVHHDSSSSSSVSPSRIKKKSNYHKSHLIKTSYKHKSSKTSRSPSYSSKKSNYIKASNYSPRKNQVLEEKIYIQKRRYENSSDSESSERNSPKKSISKSFEYYKESKKIQTLKQSSRNKSLSKSPERNRNKIKESHIDNRKKSKKYKKQESTSSSSSSDSETDTDGSQKKYYKQSSQHSSRVKVSHKKSSRRHSSS